MEQMTLIYEEISTWRQRQKHQPVSIAAIVDCVADGIADYAVTPRRFIGVLSQNLRQR